MRKYKFNLAFENDVRVGWITEKYWGPLISGTVPVYLGAPEIKKYEPKPNSILVVGDFASVEDLAKKMIELSKDDIEYNKMLEWKTQEVSDDFKILYDYGCASFQAHWCSAVADRIEDSPVTPSEYTIYIREHRKHQFRSLKSRSNTIQDFIQQIEYLFKGYTPAWWKCKETRGMRMGKFKSPPIRVFRIVQTKKSYKEVMWGDSIDSDEKFTALESGSQLDVIFY